MSDKLEQAIAAIKAGDKVTGRRLLAKALETDPYNEKAWLWMAGIIASVEHRRQCLERVLAINPNNQAAQRGLAALRQEQSIGQPRQIDMPNVKTPPQPSSSAPEPAVTVRSPRERANQFSPVDVPHVKAPPTIDYRYPTENRILLLTFIVILVALLLFTPLTLGGILILSLVGFALNYMLVRARIEGLKRNAIRVSATQFPGIKTLVDECAQRIGISPETEVVVSYSPVMNAFATGVGRPYLIVLYSALVEALDPIELKSVIGHEMGHVRFGHTTLLTMIGQLGSQTFGIPIIRDLIHYIFLFWMRASELTADRAGLVACGRLDKAIATEVKLGVGPELARRVDLRELAYQARQSQKSILGTLGEMESTHPMMTTRIQKLVDFAFSSTFRRLRPDVHLADFEGAEHWQPAVSECQGTLEDPRSPALGSSAALVQPLQGEVLGLPTDESSQQFETASKTGRSLSAVGQEGSRSSAYPPKSGSTSKLIIVILGGLLFGCLACSSCRVLQGIIDAMLS